MKPHPCLIVTICVWLAPCAGRAADEALSRDSVPPDESPSGDDGREAPRTATERGTAVASPAAGPGSPAPSKSNSSDMERRIQAALNRLSGEPSLIQLEQAALRYADAHPESTKSWRRASRVSAVLPTLKVSADCGVGRDEALDRYQDKPDRWGADTDRGYGIEVTAQWKLDELVFNPDELKVYDALADRALRRESLLASLVGYYYERRRLQLEEMLVPPTDIKEALERHIRIEELTAAIDALTGGLLSRRINH